MSLKTILVPVVMITLFWGCSKSEKKTKISDKPNLVKQTSLSGGEEETEVIKVFFAANFTDNQKWRNGIDTKEKNVFFFIIPKDFITPLAVGCRLQFASAGEAEIRTVYRMDQSDGASIFIRVNKNLDPGKDGSPNPIFLKSLAIAAGGFSKKCEWRNGISLKKPGLFFFSIKENEPVPVKIGDRLKFLKTGEAIVKEVVKNKLKKRKYIILVTVDRTLDPEKDGFPNPIEVFFNR